MDSGLFHHRGVLCMTPLPFTVWGVPRVSLRGVPCAPLSLTTLRPWGLVARIQRRIFLVCTYVMGFDVCPRIGHHFHPRAAPLFRHFGVSMGGVPSPPLLLLIIMGGLQPPPLILLVVVVGLPSPPLPVDCSKDSAMAMS